MKTNQTVRWLLSACIPIWFCPEAPVYPRKWAPAKTRTCPYSRLRLRLFRAGFVRVHVTSCMHVLAVFFTWEDRKHGAEKKSAHAEFRWRLSERPSLSLSFPALDFDLTITFTSDLVSKDCESSDPGLGSCKAHITASYSALHTPFFFPLKWQTHSSRRFGCILVPLVFATQQEWGHA